MNNKKYHQKSKGQALVEFSMVFIWLFILVFGMLDTMRIVAYYNIVAEAARQGARQAVANATFTDQPFGTYNNRPCSGQALAPSVTAIGCQLDPQIKATVDNTMYPLIRTDTMFSNTTAANCPNPPPGRAYLCISPSDTGGQTSYVNCATATAALGHTPGPGDLGSRFAEWGDQSYYGCFTVQVTVKYGYDSINPFFGPYAPSSIIVQSSTTMLTEY